MSVIKTVKVAQFDAEVTYRIGSSRTLSPSPALSPLTLALLQPTLMHLSSSSCTRSRPTTSCTSEFDFLFFPTFG